MRRKKDNVKEDKTRKKEERGRGMKKIKGLLVLMAMSISSMLWLTSCEDKLHIDEEKCAKTALEYMNAKYEAEFEIIESYEIHKYIGSAGYAEVTVKEKGIETENRYFVCVYPNGNKDEDKDDYYDSYKVVSDDYMCYLLEYYVKNDMNKLLVNLGLDISISYVSIDEMEKIKGFDGFSSDFPVQNEETFSLKTILSNHIISISCWIDIPDSEYNNELKEKIENIIRPLITSDDSILFSINIYSDEIYNKIKDLNKNNISNNEKPDKNISFVIEEEQDEFK